MKMMFYIVALGYLMAVVSMTFLIPVLLMAHP